MLTDEQQRENSERVARVIDVSEAYLGKSAVCDTKEDFVTDLLADLMHYCEFTQIDFDNQLRIARGHYDCEVLGID